MRGNAKSKAAAFISLNAISSACLANYYQTYVDQQNQQAQQEQGANGLAGSGSSGDEAFLLLIITIPLTLWLLLSKASPMRAWADSHHGAAFFFIMYAPLIPVLIYILITG